ncbi:uncharacterized protein LOC34622509 [Cyclospora cayetanensis]|uniref:Uncharacterized protein LOC34622509 n=1 Tax=Cyclospora cayetanensis TaxID=88456 RepID=A0A6P6RY64_9EIME|nr:uncharacterized protein LOC34622509 [Cyclospora cayetanensis]
MQWSRRCLVGAALRCGTAAGAVKHSGVGARKFLSSAAGIGACCVSCQCWQLRSAVTIAGEVDAVRTGAAGGVSRRALHAARAPPKSQTATAAEVGPHAATEPAAWAAPSAPNEDAKLYTVAAASRQLAATVPLQLLKSAAAATASEAAAADWSPLRALWNRCVKQQQQRDLGKDDAPLQLDHVALLLEGCFAAGMREFSVVSGLLNIARTAVAESPESLLQQLPRLSRAVRSLAFLHFDFFRDAEIAVAQTGPSRVASLWSGRDLCSVVEAFAQQRMPSAALVTTAEFVLQQQQPLLPLATAARLLLACAQLDVQVESVLQPLQERLQQLLEGQLQQRELGRVEALALGSAAEAALLLYHHPQCFQQERWMTLLLSCVERVAAFAAEQQEAFWIFPSNARLHRQLLLCRLALRTLSRHSYEHLDVETRRALRQLQRVELTHTPRPPTVFVQKFSAILSKLRIAHQAYAMRGILCFDILERDRKLAWSCDGADRFYVHTNSKTATVRLHEKITRGLGIRMAHCAYWQWNKMKARRTRIEFVRMSRYYALQDRRETDLTFEGWLLPHVHHVHKQNNIEAFCHFPNNQPLGHAVY